MKHCTTLWSFFLALHACAGDGDDATRDAAETLAAIDSGATDTLAETFPASDVAAPDASGDTPTPDAATHHGPGTDALLALMRSDDRAHYETAVADGVTFHATADGDSFYALWKPAGFDPERDGILVSLPGHDVFASTSYTVWRPFVSARRYAFIGVHWWFGTGETTADYLTPEAIYSDVAAALAEQGLPHGRALFEGFSRGSANSYAVIARDRAATTPIFALAIANAGGMNAGYGPNVEIIDGAFGATPFVGSRWVLFCGGEDTNPESDCAAMHATDAWLRPLGAEVLLFIEDPAGGHGGFHQNAANANRALDLYESLLAE